MRTGILIILAVLLCTAVSVRAVSWNELIFAGQRQDDVAAWDAVSARFILHGGFNGFVPFLNDAWAYDPATNQWASIVPADTIPDGAITHAGAFDPLRNRLITFAGNYHNDAWALGFDPPVAWTEINETGTLPTGRVEHTLVYVPGRDQLVLFGGHSGPSFLGDTWLLPLSTTSGARTPGATAATLRAAPNPATAHVDFFVDAPARIGASDITVYDVHGRVVARLRVDAETSTVSWNLTDRRGSRVTSGVYFSKWNDSAVRRVVIVR